VIIAPGVLLHIERQAAKTGERFIVLLIAFRGNHILANNLALRRSSQKPSGL